MIRVVVAENLHIVRQGVCKILEDSGEIQVIGEADNGVDALRLVRELQPDVLVLDISMPLMDGIDVLKQLKEYSPRPKVVVLSIHADLALVQKALDLGALGYVLKHARSEELLDAVRVVNRCSGYLSSGVSQILAKHPLDHRSPNLIERLSPRECDVAARIVAGQTTKEIAEELHTSIKTIEKQRRDAMRKLEVDNIASFVRVCMEHGISAETDKTMPPHH